MIGKCAELLTIRRCREEEIEDMLYRAKIQYGIRNTLEFVCQFSVLVLIAAILKQMKEFALFVCFFFLLRSYAGGCQSSTGAQRLCCMAVGQMAALCGMRLELSLVVQMSIFLAAGMVLVWCAPCGSYKETIMEPEVKRLKKSGMLLCMASYLILMLCWRGLHNVFLMSVTLEAVSALIEKRNEKARE